MIASSRPARPAPARALALAGTRALALALAGTLAAAPACAPGAEEDDETLEGEGAQIAVLPDAIAFIENDPETRSRLARIGPSRFALTGDRAELLEVGRRYKVSLATTREPARNGFEVRRLVDSSRVMTLIGTLSDDVQDASIMHLRSLHAKGYALYGETVSDYKEIRATLPAHDYTKTLFSVSAVGPLGDRAVALGGSGSGRWEWLDYTPLPRYTCTQTDSPGTHLDLIDVKPDDSLLDGFIAMPMGGREVRYGAHAACTRDGAAYACALDSIGAAWGTTRFVPGAGEAGHFELTIERADEAKTKIAFACETATPDLLARQSED